MKILLSGIPGVGKSTILKNLIKTLNLKKIKVCIVEEIRNNEKRSGFNVKYIPSEKESLLASKTLKLSDIYMSDYSVNLDAIEQEMIPFMKEMTTTKENDLLIFDEIGRMQNLSSHFIKAVDKLLESKNDLLATIVYDDEPWARKYKDDKNNFLITVTLSNRDFILPLLRAMLRSKTSFNILKNEYRFLFIEHFNTLSKEERFLELSKLFNHTIYYLSDNRVSFNSTSNAYHLCGFHGKKVVKLDAHKKLTCTCDFYQNQKLMCSHTQAVSILYQIPN